MPWHHGHGQRAKAVQPREVGSLPSHSWEVRETHARTWICNWEGEWVSSSPDTSCPWKLSGEEGDPWEWPDGVTGMAVITQRCVPLLQQLHLHQLVDGGCIFQPLDQGIHEVLVIAREDTQVVPRLVLQLLIPIGVETHEDGRSAGGRDGGTIRYRPPATAPLLCSFVCPVTTTLLLPFSLGCMPTRLLSPSSTPWPLAR